MSATPKSPSKQGSKQGKPKEKGALADSGTAKIGFFGAGKVAECLMTGLTVYGKVDAKRIFVTARTTGNTDRLKQKFPGLNAKKKEAFFKSNCDIYFLAVHGDVIKTLYKLGGSRPAALGTNYIDKPKKAMVMLSLITGYDIKCIKECIMNPDINPSNYKMIEWHRIVINCASAHGVGICCVDVEPDSAKFAEPVRALLSTMAKLEYIPEAQLDAAAAVCGAGLAFCYYFINAISDGALKIGLNRTVAVKFTAKMVSCATQTLMETGKQPNELKDEVMAPSGGAIFGLNVMDKAKVSDGVAGAVEAAHKRAQSLAHDDHPK